MSRADHCHRHERTSLSGRPCLVSSDAAVEPPGNDERAHGKKCQLIGEPTVATRDYDGCDHSDDAECGQADREV